MIVFAHGLEGSPEGRKVVALQEANFQVHAPDFRNLMLADRVRRLRDEMAALDVSAPILLAGSSYGGLCVAAVAAEFAPTLCGLLLLAPALGHREDGPDGSEIVGADLVAPNGIPTVVIHGTQDTICSIDDSREYAERSDGVELIAVDDGHRLTDSLAVICHHAAKLVSTSNG